MTQLLKEIHTLIMNSIRPKKRSYRAKKMILPGRKYKNRKNVFSAKTKYFVPYGDSGRFGVTEWSGFIFCVEIDPTSPTFCLTE